MKNYYEILGINKDATPDEIRSAYRIAAKKYHPDVSKESDAAEKFKEANEAYEVLSDPQKRAKYDSPSPVHMDIGSIFDQFMHGRRPQKAPDIVVVLKITLEEAIKGCSKEISYKRKTECEKCNGTGASSLKTCISCNGLGKRQMKSDPWVIYSTCNACGGAGKTVEAVCSECNGNGFKEGDKETVSVNVPIGVDSGMAMQISGCGERGKGISNGNLIIQIQVEKHPIFDRDNDNLLLDIPLTYSQLMLGYKVNVPKIDGSVDFKVPPKTHPGTEFRLEGLGVPNFRNHIYGDLLVKVDLKIPKKISEDYKKLLKQLSELED